MTPERRGDNPGEEHEAAPFGGGINRPEPPIPRSNEQAPAGEPEDAGILGSLDESQGEFTAGSIIDQQPQPMMINAIKVEQPDGSINILPGRYMTAEEASAIAMVVEEARRARLAGDVDAFVDLEEWLEKGDSAWDDEPSDST